ncbi:Glyoxylase, beta-lactamase superfamily II [Malonomonas rubra DSM 5091]|uniref:Glyoxylase, beta-lactamase superfamily II n=1 Tax=Malonomonas rubra DSM 5091 TaxID=1122189 RepID=A0A1M6HF22_MALRU|nr:MBL fold metallo-hydrolase [Malonomonas rubra]SHJ20743.1 Glyoxylase, beta-lactamase superfamily II [Malonomonas rubra DSM 5091]
MRPTQHTLATPYPVGPVHFYSIEINGQLILIDTGAPTSETKDYLLNKLDLDRLQHVLITHCHIDHYGLAAWLEQEYGCTIYLPYRDSLKITQHHKRLNGMVSILRDIGFSADFATAFRCEMDNDSVFPDFPQNFKIAEQNLPVELGIDVIPCPGHSQSDLVYATNDWAVTGDTMLREIFQSPLLDIDLLTGERFSNYQAYCATITKLASLRGRQIFPGHRDYIVSVDNNICYYTGKLLERAARSRQYSVDLSAPQVVDKLFGGSIKEPFLKYLKTSEVIFIRDFLAEPDRLKNSLQQIDLFSQMAELFELATGET